MKYITHSSGILRCRIKYIKSENVIELRVQKYRNWLAGWVNYNMKVDIQLTDAAIDNWIVYPRILNYQFGGQREIWNSDTFNLEERANSLLTEYADGIKKHLEMEHKIKSML